MAEIEKNAMFKLSYGLFVLTSTEFGKDNGCIINTVIQVTDSPKRIAIAVNKGNRTHDMIQATGQFNVSVLTEEAPFSVFERFGFQSGRDVDKFAGDLNVVRTENWIRYLPEYTNAVISGAVISTVDCGTHTLFVADVTEAKVLSDVPSVTYAYYFKHIKPKPASVKTESTGKKRWVCKICGYVYEGDELPADFVCPLCKHGADDFELVEES
ncbi:MAG: flavin reductase [Eubacteriales bacterium]